MANGGALLRDFLWWWARQMRSLLPGFALPRGRFADALLVDVEGAPAPQFVHLSLRRRRREVSLGRFRLDEAGKRGARAAIRRHPRRMVLRPDRSAVLERNVVLPLAAERDLSQVLHHEMDRLTPFCADQVFWSASQEHRDAAAERLEVCLTVIPKTLLRPVIALLEAAGLAISAIEAVGTSGSPRLIDLLAPSRRHRASLAFARGLVGALAVVAAVMPVITLSLASNAVEARIAALQPQIAQVEALRRRIAGGSAGSTVIAAERARVGDALQVLATTTELIPDDTVLSDLSLHQGKLSISGQSATAPRLIPALAADPTVGNPSFAAPVTRTPDGKADTFVIRAELRH